MIIAEAHRLEAWHDMIVSSSEATASRLLVSRF
jgi:hypothetical protein